MSNNLVSFRGVRTGMMAVAALLSGGAFAEDACIQTDGTQYFNSGYYPNPNTRIVADYAFTSPTPVQQRIFGENGATAGLSLCHYINGSGMYAYTFKNGDGDWISTGVTVTTDRRTIELDGPNNFVRLTTGEVVSYSNKLNGTRSQTSYFPLQILANGADPQGNINENPFGRVKLYSLQIYENGAPVHDFRPYATASRVGLKDTVSGKVLLTCAGSDPVAVNVTVEADPVLTWTGAVDTDWAKPGNWRAAGAATADQAPQTCDRVVIPAGSTISLANFTTTVPSVALSGAGTVTLTDCVPKLFTSSLEIPAGTMLAPNGTLYASAATVNGAALAAGTSYTASESWLAAGTLNLGADSATIADGVLTLAVTPGRTLRYTTQLGASVTKVVKIGPGTAVVSNDLNSAFVGTVEIREGILEAQSGLLRDHRVFGAKAENTIKVFKDAQIVLRVPGPAAQGDKQFPNDFEIAGSGPNGTGAIRCYRYSGKSGSQGNCDSLFANVRLTDDAMIRTEARIGVSNGTVDIGDHTLTLYRGSGSFMIYGGSVWSGNGGRIVFANGLVPCSQGTATFSGAGTIDFPANVTGGMQFWSSTIKQESGADWTVDLGSGNYFKVGAGTGENDNTLPFGVRLGAGTEDFSTYTGTTGLKQHLAGVISGEGKLVKKAQHTLFVDGRANTWSGGVQATTTDGTGPIVFTYPGGLPGRTTSGQVTINGSAILAIRPGEGYWTQSDASELAQNATLNGWLGLYVPSGTGAMSGDWPAKVVHLRKIGAGTASLDGNWNVGTASTGQFRSDEGTTILGGEHLYRSSTFTLAGGTVNLADGAYLHVTNATTTIGASNNATSAKLRVGEGSTFMAISTNLVNIGANPNFNDLLLGDTGTKPAIIEIDGGTITGKLYAVKDSANQKGAIYLRRGEFVQYSGPTADGYLAYNGYCYLGQEGGTFKVRAHTGMMSQPSSVGMYDLKDGLFTYAGTTGQGCCNFTLSRGGGHGELYMTGGTFDGATGGQNFYFGIQGWSYPTDGLGVATVNGSNALMKVNMVDMGQRLTNYVSVLNVLQGTVQTKYIEHSTGSTRVNCPGYVNLNGGTLRGAADNTDFFGSGVKKCARVTVFERGFTFDTAGYNDAINQVPLLAPSGKGIQSIAIPSGVATNGYFGPPEVTITGDGTGATAHCCFDRATGTIGPVVVTSPGWDYTTATATIKSADRAKSIALAVTLADQRGGGLTKTGAGTLKINATCTYPGTTVVKEGTLQICRSDALPATNAVRCAGGTLDCNAKEIAFGSLGGYGTLANGTVTATKLAFDAADYEEDLTRRLNITATLDPVSSVEIANTNRLEIGKVYTLATSTTPFPVAPPSNLVRPWCVYLGNGGKSLKLHYQQGTFVVFR